MTREEAIKILKAIRVYECYPKSASEETKEAIDMAIEALSAEPCNKDAVSREGLLKSWEELSPRGRTEFDQVIMTIPALPSADRPKGRWVYCKHTGISDVWKCDQCEAWMFGKTNYCHNCGADMRSEVM